MHHLDDVGLCFGDNEVRDEHTLINHKARSHQEHFLCKTQTISAKNCIYIELESKASEDSETLWSILKLLTCIACAELPPARTHNLYHKEKKKT